jgi:hypothetical protein
LFGSSCTPGAETETIAFAISFSSIMRSVDSTDQRAARGRRVVDAVRAHQLV